MNVTFKSISLLIFSAILGGCAAPSAQQSPVIFTEQPHQQHGSYGYNSLDELMLYFDLLQKKNAAQLTQEYNDVKNRFKNDIEAENRLKYILLISLPNTAFTNVQAALDLLNNWPQDITLPPNLASFKKLLILLLTEQQTAKTHTKNLLQKLKATEEHAQILQNRIDAIKSIEKSPIRRITP
ncbi:dihydrolipoamide acyltransferase [Nitrosomonas communis]|uniref:dihydrolipoamide acyltransferase n=1 Tax=Nitrosomonas communis TaxID=44574 RepID=UPI0026F3482A|nr:dihydrolipoamide acyltransferase [Nitrosomonas communis]MCO6426533.1 dihydrolipoamide acyltransferase [Nitrosomonas communis]